MICFYQRRKRFNYSEREMTMTTNVTVKAYRFEELSDKGKEKVVSWLNDGVMDTDSYECEVDNTKDDLKELGYEDIDIKWSGFYSQGDGAAITCNTDVVTFIKRNKWAKKYASLYYWAQKEKMYIGVKQQSYSRYNHENTLYSEYESAEDDLYGYEESGFNVSPKAFEQLKSCAADFLEEVKTKSQELFSRLQKECDYHYSEEYIKDMCDANEYIFDEYGKPIHHIIVLPVKETAQLEI